MTIDKPTTLDAPGRREVTEPTTAAGRQPTKPLGSGLDALWEALAADIHAHGYSVRDALAAHRLAIEAEARATATDLDALNAYLDTIDPEKAEARAQVEALTIDHHKAAAVFDRMVRAEAQVAELRAALADIEYVGDAAHRNENWIYSVDTMTERAHDALAATKATDDQRGAK
jgi:hypothetical protein